MTLTSLKKFAYDREKSLDNGTNSYYTIKVRIRTKGVGMKKAEEMARKVVLATTKIDGAYYLFARKLGMKEHILTVLYALDDGKPHTQKQIGEDWLIPKTTVNTCVGELVDSGYVRLLAGAGTREKTIVLTEEGRLYTERIMKCVYESERAAMDRTLEAYSPEFAEAVDYFAECIRDEFQSRLSKEGHD